MWVARWELPKRPKQQCSVSPEPEPAKQMCFRLKLLKTFTYMGPNIPQIVLSLLRPSHFIPGNIWGLAGLLLLLLHHVDRRHSVYRGKQFEETMAGRAWKISAVVAVSLALFAISEFRVAEAQELVNECVTDTARCAPHAFCRDTITAYRCFCRAGYYGDGYLGAGYSGCTRRRLSTWQIATSIIGSILGALLIFCLCLVCLRSIFRRRRGTDYPVQQGGPAYGYPQQSYPPQQGVPMYPTHNQKVPEPAGVV